MVQGPFKTMVSKNKTNNNIKSLGFQKKGEDLGFQKTLRFQKARDFIYKNKKRRKGNLVF